MGFNPFINDSGGGGVTSYSPLTEKPKIDNHTLQAGNNTSSDLGLQTKIDPEHKLSADNVDDTNSTNKFNVKSDWNAASGATAEILNKPTLGTASAKNVPASGDAATGEVVLGSDTRLTDARNAKDVYNWAKQENKPSYTYSEIQNPPTIPDELSDLADDSTHRTVTDTEKDTWNGKQNALTFDDAPTSSSNNPVKSGGVYTALSGKQNNLSEAQMAAANSGATADKINKIAVNENNILLLEQANGAKNQINIPNGTYTAGTSSYSVTNGAVTSTATDNTTHAIDLSIWTLKAGTYVFYDDSSDLSAVQYRIYQQSPDTRLTPAGQNPATFTLANDTVVYLSCYTFKTGTMTTRPMLMTKATWDAGFTDYQPYALSNAELTAKEQVNENNISTIQQTIGDINTVLEGVL